MMRNRFGTVLDRFGGFRLLVGRVLHGLASCLLCFPKLCVAIFVWFCMVVICILPCNRCLVLQNLLVLRTRCLVSVGSCLVMHDFRLFLFGSAVFFNFPIATTAIQCPTPEWLRSQLEPKARANRLCSYTLS